MGVGERERELEVKVHILLLLVVPRTWRKMEPQLRRHTVYKRTSTYVSVFETAGQAETRLCGE